MTVLRKRLLIWIEVVGEHVQDGTLNASDLVAGSVLSEGLGPHVRRGLHARSERHARVPLSRIPRLLAAIRRPSRVVSDGSVQSVQRDVSGIAGTEILAVREVATVASEAIVQIVQIGLNGSGPTELNVSGASDLNVERVTTVDSDVASGPTEPSVSVARARAVNNSTTGESVRAVSEDLATRMVPKMRDGMPVLSLVAMIAALLAVGQTTVSADVRTEVMTGSADVQTLIVVARDRAVEGNLEIASSPLRGQI